MFSRQSPEQADIPRTEPPPALAFGSPEHPVRRSTPAPSLSHVRRNLKLLSFDTDTRREQSRLLDDRGRFEPSPGTPLEVVPAAAAITSAKRPAQWLRNSAILFSFCLHGAIALTMIDWSDSAEQFGTVAEKSDAISLAMEQTVVLESIETESIQTAAAASAASQAGSVEAAQSAPQPVNEAEEAVEAAEPPPPRPLEVAEVTPAALNPTEDPLTVIRGAAEPDEVSEIKAIDPVETVEEVQLAQVETQEVETESKEREAEQKVERKLTAQAESRASAAGSTTSRASAAQSAKSGRVSASRGNVLNYAARIRTVLSRNKPMGDGHSGTTRVSFGVTASGDLSYVKIAGSSGRANLDQLAMAAVRRAAPFGTPPEGVSPNDLRFTIPFYFR
ncbi:hypothetical protein DLM45_07405 [Hyphomicrobium methylovorum]|uniref:energy transducer TonB family protein n=1 Tax=Hyphomicrobium methylovorum TaxID=84 RepID=UPI0015E68BA6|nr:energy transducer TonB [Hyphomicrobium methylovorum]MBA2126049.1 hypothetical protein [Hyphomicrobium methylovorum]